VRGRRGGRKRMGKTCKMRRDGRDWKTGHGIKSAAFWREDCKDSLRTWLLTGRIPGIFVQYIRRKRKKKHVKESGGAVLSCATAGKITIEEEIILVTDSGVGLPYAF
jgi:hypothetical protein